MTTVKLELKGLPEGLQPGAFELALNQEMIRATNEALVVTREGMISASPFGGTSELKNSWIITPAVIAGRAVVGRVVAEGSIAAKVIEDGAEPHHPPVGDASQTPALGVWIRRKLGITDPKAIRQAAFGIGARMKIVGIEGSQLFSRKFLAIRATLQARMGQIVPRIKARFQV